MKRREYTQYDSRKTEADWQDENNIEPKVIMGPPVYGPPFVDDDEEDDYEDWEDDEKPTKSSKASKVIGVSRAGKTKSIRKGAQTKGARKNGKNKSRPGLLARLFNKGIFKKKKR